MEDAKEMQRISFADQPCQHKYIFRSFFSSLTKNHQQAAPYSPA